MDDEYDRIWRWIMDNIEGLYYYHEGEMDIDQIIDEHIGPWISKDTREKIKEQIDESFDEGIGELDVRGIITPLDIPKIEPIKISLIRRIGGRIGGWVRRIF